MCVYVYMYTVNHVLCYITRIGYIMPICVYI